MNIWWLNLKTRPFKDFVFPHMETPSIKHHYKGRDINEDEAATLLSLISLAFVSRLKKNICILKRHDQNLSQTNYPPPSAFFSQQMNRITSLAEPLASYGLVVLTIFEVSCSNFISCILSRISGACWKLPMTDVSPHCHTPCIIWFGKQHTAFCSISMSQTVCKQLVITQFSENHYFPMKCWMSSKLGFGMAKAAPVTQCSPVSQVGEEERWREQPFVYFFLRRIIMWERLNKKIKQTHFFKNHLFKAEFFNVIFF